MAWDMADKGVSVWPPPPSCRKGHLSLGRVGRGKEKESPPVCVSVTAPSPGPSLHSPVGHLGFLLCSLEGPELKKDRPALLSWPKATTQALGVLGWGFLEGHHGTWTCKTRLVAASQDRGASCLRARP